MVKAMKKVLACALAAVLTLGVAVDASAATSSPVASVEPVTKEDVKATNGTKVDIKSNGTATLNSLSSSVSKKKSVTISSTVTVNGVKYKVTTVDAGAFAKAKKATKITLPATITKINKNAFKGAKKVKTIVLKSSKAITVKKGAFAGVNTKKITIKVSKKMSKKQLAKLKKALKKAGFKGKVKRA